MSWLLAAGAVLAMPVACEDSGPSPETPAVIPQATEQVATATPSSPTPEATLPAKVRAAVNRINELREYRHQSSGRTVKVHSYREDKDLLDAVFASGRLGLPFRGVLLFGY